MPLRGDKLKKRPTGAIVGVDPARAARREQSDIHQTGQCGVVSRTATCGLRTAGAFGAHQGRPLTSQTAFGGQLPYEGSLGGPLRPVGHILNGPMWHGFANGDLRPARPIKGAHDLRRTAHDERHRYRRCVANCELRPANGAPYEGRHELRAPSAPIIDVTRSCRYNEE